MCRRGASDDLVAYARAMLFHGFSMVMEYGYEPQAVDAMLALVRHIGETASGAALPLGGGSGDVAALFAMLQAPNALYWTADRF